RAYGPAQAVIVPYVEQVIQYNTVFADIRSDEAAFSVNSPASYTVSLDNAQGAITVPDDFDCLGEEEITAMFEGSIEDSGDSI
ncbi:MAG: hypothetical protein FWH52_06685, partial [Synergistaceae bacterium]|nr:hypothetical protein [Synergistaceae bacterium]